jgi:hypothetical protein
MAITKSIAATQIALDAMNADCNAGKVKFYTGSPPAIAAAPTGTFLGEATLNTPAWGVASAANPAVALLNVTPAPSGSVGTSGTPGYFRVTDTGGTAYFQGTVALTTGGDVNFDNITWVVGGTITVSGLTTTLSV